MTQRQKRDELLGRGWQRNLEVAVVGLGYWGPNLIRVLAERLDVRLRWLCDADASRLARIARRYPAVRLTTDLDQVLDDPEVDAVLLATPVFTHHELGRRCLEAGKHTYVEKPLASSSELATDLIDLSRESGLQLMCGHTFLYSPAVRAIGDLIREGRLGELYFLSSSRVNLGLHQRDVSVVWDLGPHDFSILLHWLGCMPTTIRATGRDSIVPGIADVAFVTLEFASGLIANVELSWLAPSKLRRTVIAGSRQMVVYEDGSTEAIKIFDSGVDYRDPETFGEYQLSYRSGDIVSPHLPVEEPLALQVEDFLRGIRSDRRSTSQLDLTRDVVRLAEAAEASLQDGGAQILLDGVGAHGRVV
ncbi:MAG: Gfo/Idh/MocA family oxidoreductase [Solirubrobacterales bacterium]|nr:Gfo/Idh/MocA family oxidoreductase [Solirubrobacterales bacterium]